MFGARRVVEELEVPLFEAESGSRAGKIERKQYGDGEHRMRIRVNLHVPGPGSAGVFLDGALVAEVQLTNGRGESDLRTRRGDAVPVISAGQMVDIVYGGRIVASGTFAPD